MRCSGRLRLTFLQMLCTGAAEQGAPVLNGFGHMCGGNNCGLRQIGNRPAHAQRAVHTACRPAQLGCRVLQQLQRGGLGLDMRIQRMALQLLVERALPR